MNYDIPKYLQRKPIEKQELSLWVYIGGALLVMALTLWLYILTPTVRAEDTIKYSEVHTEHEACMYLHQHPGHVKGINHCEL